MAVFCGRGDFAETGSCDAVVGHAAVPVRMTICLWYKQLKPKFSDPQSWQAYTPLKYNVSQTLHNILGHY